jgi:hypothetical protein
VQTVERSCIALEAAPILISQLLLDRSVHRLVESKRLSCSIRERRKMLSKLPDAWPMRPESGMKRSPSPGSPFHGLATQTQRGRGARRLKMDSFYRSRLELWWAWRFLPSGVLAATARATS